MIDNVHLVVGASGAGIAAGLTWAAQLPARRRADRRADQSRTRAEQALARAERQAEDAAATARADALRQIAEARAEAAENWSQLQHVMAELGHLVEVRLPAVLQELQGVRVPIAVGLRRPDLLADSEAAGYLEAAEDAVRAAGAAVRRRVEDSARAGVRVAAEEIQASLTRAQRDIDSGFDDHDDLGRPGGLSGTASAARTLARVDHSVTLATHTVQRLRILTESWPGVQRADCTVAEIVESARGRIRQSDAVDYTYLAQTGEAVVEGLIVEPVIVALTELLDNAAAYSGEAVATHVQLVPTGMRITVEDQGLGMSPAQLAEAEAALAAGTTDVTGLAEPGKLGFLVIGRLMQVYGLLVGLSPSASGGVRADLLIPAAHLVAAAEPIEEVPVVPAEPAPLRRRIVVAREAPASPAAAAAVPVDPAAPLADAPVDDASSGVSARAGQGPDEPGPDEPGPTAHGLTAHGLPRRQPRKAVRRTAAPRQQEVSDPDAFAAGFAQLRGVLATGYGDDSLDEG
ncbi:hypothetical protein [Yinghuangia soli]|uniref:histidine kinase n=1 Tax=Yinghuangia soli TaxID=2908204 RepID=A0AA41Q2F1_9ACTN|nr:hypothetical protein [Yinghuangia soli]MCF2529700.1 hypothetical protein [Yinghuangia soli]